MKIQPASSQVYINTYAYQVYFSTIFLSLSLSLYIYLSIYLSLRLSRQTERIHTRTKRERERERENARCTCLYLFCIISTALPRVSSARQVLSFHLFLFFLSFSRVRLDSVFLAPPTTNRYQTSYPFLLLKRRENLFSSPPRKISSIEA